MPLFGKDIAVDLMFTESCILVAVLLRLASIGIAALPMHDGIMVQCSHKEAAREIMEIVAARHSGSPIPVVIKLVGSSSLAGRSCS